VRCGLLFSIILSCCLHVAVVFVFGPPALLVVDLPQLMALNATGHWRLSYRSVFTSFLLNWFDGDEMLFEAAKLVEV